MEPPQLSLLDIKTSRGACCWPHMVPTAGRIASGFCTARSNHPTVRGAQEAQSSLGLELVLEGPPLLPTVLLVGRPVLLLALGATVPGHLAAPADVELPELKGHRTVRQRPMVGARRGQQGAGRQSTCFSIIVQGG